MKLLKFYAEWCGPCKGLSMIVEGVKDKIDIEIENVDIDTCGSRSAQYNIRSVPTMVLVDDNGTELKRKVGSMNEADLLNFLKV